MGLITEVVQNFKADVKDQKFDWLDMAQKQLAVFINISVEESGQSNLIKLDIFEELQELVKFCKCGDQLQREILERTFNLYSKLFRNKNAVEKVLHHKHVVFKAILYFNSQFEGDLQMNALRTLHPLMKNPEFKKVCYEEHSFTSSMFDAYPKEAMGMFFKSLEADN